MNERAANALIDAAMRGVKQVAGALHRDGGHCAIGVLHVAMHDGDEEAAVRCFSGPHVSAMGYAVMHAEAWGGLPFVIYRPPGFGPASIGKWPVTFRLEHATNLLIADGWGSVAGEVRADG